MEHREMKKLGISPSLLGFGCMRFPLTPDGKIDEPEAERILDHAIANGVTYIDTAYNYHGGNSEEFVGRVLKKYDRDSFYLATKLPVWKLEKPEDAERIFQEQLDRLGVDHIDFYLLHSLDRKSFEDKVIGLNVIPFCEEMKRQGKIRNLGFSFHDDYEIFERILTYRDWDFCQIQYNYLDTDIQAGDRGYALTEKLGIPLVIMEPVKGGILATLPDSVTEGLRNYRKDASLASYAFRWVGSKPNVKVILSGMSSMEQVEDNLRTFADFQPLNEEEQKLIANTAQAIKSRTQNGCTGCEYCMPCPFGVNIPKNFRIWNEYAMYENAEQTKKRYEGMEEAQRSDQCKECGKCEAVCPQHLSIREDLKKVAQAMKAL